MLSFAWPWMIICLPLPWVLSRLVAKKHLSQPLPIILFPKLQLLKTAFVNSTTIASNNRYNWQRIVATAAWILLIISLMRPELIRDYSYSKNVGYDLMLAVDLSRSMDIADFFEHGKPISRINATKKVVTNFVNKRAGDRVGLVVFADQAYLTIPLTLDTLTASKLLNNLLVGMAGERTAIGDAIGIGVQNLRNRPLASRILILLTDGEDTASRIPPLEAAKIAKHEDIKIYTIGVGNKLDEGLLYKIAEMTGGIYYKVTDVNSLQQVYENINQLEKTEAMQRVVMIKQPLYYIFLSTALVLFMILYVNKKKGYSNAVCEF